MNPDFTERTYTAEVMKIAVDPNDAMKTICRMTTGPREDQKFQESNGKTVRVIHAFVGSERSFHRNPRRVVGAEGKDFQIPRTTKIRGVECFLYDIFVAQSGNHIVVAAPFHALAEYLFPKIDRSLAGTQTVHEKLDITELVIQLDAAGSKDINMGQSN